MNRGGYSLPTDPREIALRTRCTPASSDGSTACGGKLALEGGEVEVVAPQRDQAVVDDEHAGDGQFHPTPRHLESIGAFIHHHAAVHVTGRDLVMGDPLDLRGAAEERAEGRPEGVLAVHLPEGNIVVLDAIADERRRRVEIVGNDRTDESCDEFPWHLRTVIRRRSATPRGRVVSQEQRQRCGELAAGRHVQELVRVRGRCCPGRARR